MITSFVSILYIPYRFFITISEYIYNNSRIGDKILLSLQKGIKFWDKLQFVNYRVFIRGKPRRRAGEYQRFT
jgi:hypothetical protein